MVVTKDLREKLENSATSALIVPSLAGLDGICGALALKHSFDMQGKKLLVVYDGDLPKEVAELPGAEEIKKNLGSKDLVLKFNVGSSGVDKISYSVSNDILSLRVRPKNGSFNVENFDYTYEASSYDTLVTFGVSKLEDISFYTEYKAAFDKAEVLNLGEPLEKATDVTQVTKAIKEEGEGETDGDVGSEDIDHNKKSDQLEAKSISQFIFEQLVAWGITPNKKAAICLLTGISL